MSDELGFADRDPRLTETELRKRLGSYLETSVTDEIYSFGSKMVDRTLDRFKTLDTKAAAIAAYSIGVITVLTSRVETWGFLLILSVALAFAAAMSAVFALLLRKTYESSQDEWINEKHLSDAEALKRYHIITMWGIIDSHQAACSAKALRIAIAETLLLLSALLLVIAIIVAWVS